MNSHFRSIPFHFVEFDKLDEVVWEGLDDADENCWEWTGMDTYVEVPGDS